MRHRCLLCRLRTVWDSVFFRLFLIGSTVLMLLLQLWGLSLFGDAFDPQRAGTVASWFTGLLTVGVIMTGVIALRADRARFDSEVMRQEKAKKNAEVAAHDAQMLAAREAAGRVYAWLEPVRDKVGRVTTVDCHVENKTSMPVYQWQVEAQGTDARIESTVAGPIIPGHSRHKLPTDPWAKLVRDADSQRVVIQFMAANGELLRRESTGELKVVAGT